MSHAPDPPDPPDPPDAFDAGGARTDRDRILLAGDSDRNRELLADALAEVPGYEVVTASAPGEVPEAYDLCILPEDVLERFRPALEARVRAADPVYLPGLLLRGDGAGRRAIGSSDRGDGGVIDDVVTLPVEKWVLQRRVESLLRTRRASVRLAEREDQYRRLVELTPEAILLVEDDRIRYGNEAAVGLFGVGSTDALAGRSLVGFAVEEDRGTLRDLLATVTEVGRSREFVDVTFRSAEGRTVPSEAVGVRVTYEGRPVIQVVIRDLTERAERERRLGVFERAIEASAQGITVADARQPDTPLVYANPAFERITGYGLDEVLGRNCRFLQGEHTDAGAVAEVREAIDDERPVTVELLNYRADATPFWNRLDIVPVEDDDGTVTHFLGLQRDVTEQKEREQRLAVLDRILRHNLSNKVNVMRGYAERIEDGDGDPTEAAARIVAASDELLALAEQVRAFRGVITAEERSLEAIDLVAVVRDAAAGLGALRLGGSLALEAPETAAVRAHRTLPAAIRHLLVLIDRGDDPRLEVRVSVDDRVLLEVIDHGGTLRAEDLRIANTHRETPLDHLQGLELWLVRWATEYSGGEFTVDPDGEPPAIRMRFDRAAGADGTGGNRDGDEDR